MGSADAVEKLLWDVEEYAIASPSRGSTNIHTVKTSTTRMPVRLASPSSSSTDQSMVSVNINGEPRERDIAIASFETSA
jgi:hypothetical protein